MQQDNRDEYAFALGYFYGRAIGSDEPGYDEMLRRYGPSSAETARAYADFRSGYDAGVADYSDDEE